MNIKVQINDYIVNMRLEDFRSLLHVLRNYLIVNPTDNTIAEIYLRFLEIYEKEFKRNSDIIDELYKNLLSAP